MLLKVSRIRIALLVLPFILIFYVLRQKPSNASIPIKHEQFNPPSSRVISPIIQPESKPALQSESKPALQPVELKQNLRYAYINGHAGTSADFTYLAEHVGFTFSEFDVRNIHIWGQSQDKANDLNFHKLAEFFCTGFDVIAVGDVNTDARFLLQYIDQDPEDGSPRRDGKQRCAVKRIIMQTTNRFDFGVSGDDQQEWFNLVKRVVKRKDSVITWVYNNPWEKRYMEVRLGKNNLPTKMFLIRPFGFSKLPPAKKVSKEEADKPVIFDHPFIGKYHKVLTEAGIDVKLLGWQYGGPTALAQYRCVIDLPYQTRYIKFNLVQ